VIAGVELEVAQELLVQCRRQEALRQSTRVRAVEHWGVGQGLEMSGDRDHDRMTVGHQQVGCAELSGTPENRVAFEGETAHRDVLEAPATNRAGVDVLPMDKYGYWSTLVRQGVGLRSSETEKAGSQRGADDTSLERCTIC
jgi:hypothetical protein